MGHYAKKFFGQAQREGIVTDGLELWLDASNPASYPGDGTTWYDLSGNVNNGIMVNGVAYSTANGGVMRFDGVDDRVPIVNSRYIYYNQPFTLSAWVNLSAFTSTHPTIFSLNSDGNGYWVCLSNRVSYLGLYFGAASVFSRFKTNTPTSYFLNKWVQITITYDGVNPASVNSFKAYIDNVDTAFNAGSPMANNNKSSLIGWRSDDFTAARFNGQINDTIIYSRALTPAEVNQNFNATKSKYGL